MRTGVTCAADSEVVETLLRVKHDSVDHDLIQRDLGSASFVVAVVAIVEARLARDAAGDKARPRR